MQRNHEQRDAEQSWQEDRSSAGQPTQQIGGAGWEQPGFVPNRRNQMLALGLLAIGLIMLLGQIGSGIAMPGTPALPGLPAVPAAPPLPGTPAFDSGINPMPGLTLLTIASGFLFFAFWRRIYGLLIPGCILAGLSLGVTYVDLTGGVSIMWGLALGFVGIALIGRRLFQQQRAWPIIPAVILFCVGTIMAISQLPGFFPLGNTLLMLPLLLIGAGLYLGWGRPAHHQR